MNACQSIPALEWQFYIGYTPSFYQHSMLPAAKTGETSETSETSETLETTETFVKVKDIFKMS